MPHSLLWGAPPMFDLFLFGPLLIDILSNDIRCNIITYCANIPAIVPKVSAPKLFLDFRVALEQFSGYYAFHNLHNFRWRILRGCTYKNMHMISIGTYCIKYD